MKKIFFIATGIFLMLSLVLAVGQSDINAQKSGSGEIQKIKLQSGEHIAEGGQHVMIKQEANSQLRLEVGGKSAVSSISIDQESVDGKTKFHAQLSNGKNAEIKIMPDAASEHALEKLRLRVCSEENGCSIELKEIGEGEGLRAAYEVQVERHSRILGIFAKKMQVRAQIDAENGEVVNVDKPWWAFLAMEPAE
jgi:hypothetical protein